ncbi:HU family DNA-binding protein [Candidatus Arsenophonus triatominarum]|uniref:HU family DNA-binding protein n=1 Tax=Candidatus Arsenophonus triatominarum TaxID=57911 RepID=UPI0007C56661
MNKTELISKVAAKSGLSKKDAEKAVNSFIETVTESLKSGNDVQLIGFGNFQVKQRAAREGWNPKTGEPLKIAAANVPSFKAGQRLKEAVKYMYLKIFLITTAILSGCSSQNLSNQKISLMKNDELCRALGKYNKDGFTVLNLTTEIERRGPIINQERCYALSRIKMNPNDYITYGDTDYKIWELRKERNKHEEETEIKKQREEQQKYFDRLNRHNIDILTKEKEMKQNIIIQEQIERYKHINDY